MLRQGLRPVLVGLIAGIGAAWLSGGLLSSLLYAVTPGDPYMRSFEPRDGN